MPSDETVHAGTPLSTLEGVGRSRSQALEDAGYATVSDVRDVDAQTLVDDAGLPQDVAESALEQAAPDTSNSSLADVRKRAQQIPGAKAKTVKTEDGRQVHKVLTVEETQHLAGADVTIRKG